MVWSEVFLVNIQFYRTIDSFGRHRLSIFQRSRLFSERVLICSSYFLLGVLVTPRSFARPGEVRIVSSSKTDAGKFLNAAS